MENMNVQTDILLVLDKVKILWKDLINNNEPGEKRIFNIFNSYKLFLKDNPLCTGPLCSAWVMEVEELLEQYHELYSPADKRNLLNEAYVGLMLGLSDSMDELKNKMEEETEEAVAELI